MKNLDNLEDNEIRTCTSLTVVQVALYLMAASVFLVNLLVIHTIQTLQLCSGGPVFVRASQAYFKITQTKW
jgi:hypothetical protein